MMEREIENKNVSSKRAEEHRCAQAVGNESGIKVGRLHRDREDSRVLPKAWYKVQGRQWTGERTCSIGA